MEDGSYVRAFEAFKAQNRDYHSEVIDRLRAEEFSRLDKPYVQVGGGVSPGHVYFDYTGANLYPQSLVTTHSEELLSQVYGNPHSVNPTSHQSAVAIEAAREKVLQFFNADSNDYCCVFTSNATGALKIVGECYPFNKGGAYLYCEDNHNSVLGIRQYAFDKGAVVNDIELGEGNALDLDTLAKKLHEVDRQLVEHKGLTSNSYNKLFAFPAQSNATGVKHDLAAIKIAKDAGWDVLLDAAAFVPTNTLDLTLLKSKGAAPDYVSVSFYKMFGYPTGVGCLLIKIPDDRSGMSPFAKLWYNKPWFAGGTVGFVSSCSQPLPLPAGKDSAAGGNLNFVLQRNYQCFEEGTVSYLSIPAVKRGLEFLEARNKESIIGKHVSCLMSWLANQLKLRVHSETGQRLAMVCGENHIASWGSTILIKFYYPDGQQYWCGTLEDKLNQHNATPGNRQLSVRIGTFCNPGIDKSCSNHQMAELGERMADKVTEFEYDFRSPLHDLTCGKERMPDKKLLNSKNSYPGGMRVSVGMATNFNDLYVFLGFVDSLLDRPSK